MNKDFLPFYNSLSQEEKDSFLEFSKEELIDHFIANLKNAECLLNRINKAIEYIEENCSNYYVEKPHYRGIEFINIEELLEILKGEK